MKADDILAAVGTINPGTLHRARRLVVAVHLLRDGMPASEARHLVRQRFGCDRVEAWRIVSMAIDMAGPAVDDGQPAEQPEQPAALEVRSKSECTA